MTHHIGYKHLRDGYMAKLAILDSGINNELRSGIKRQNAKTAEYRCSKALVLDIYHKDTKERVDKGVSLNYRQLVYEVGKVVEVEDYEKNLEKTCSRGIHYFLSEECAYFYATSTYGYNGVFKAWYANGQMLWLATYKDGKLHGKAKKWDDKGGLVMIENYKDGVLDGEQLHYYYGTKKMNYRDGCLNGPYEVYYKNGKLQQRKYYVNDITQSIEEYSEDGKLISTKKY